METEITIFDIPEKEITINKSQRELEYEILEKNSMQLEGVKKEQEKFENRYVDIVLYAKFKK